MATITSISQALAQYAAALPWQSSRASAESALDAVRYLLINRAQNLNDSQTGISYQSLESEKHALETYLGVVQHHRPSDGRSRRIRAAFQSGGIA